MNIINCTPSNIGELNSCYGTDGSSIDDIINYWCDNDCILPLENTLNNIQDQRSGIEIFSYNPDSLNNVQSFVNNLFNKYQQKYNITSNKNDPKYNPFQNQLLNICLNKALPGVCDNFLNNFCPNNLPKNNNIISNLCGCYVSTDVDPPECNPLCARANTVQKSNLKNGDLITCSPNVCAITDTTISLINSQVKGKLNFTNICTGCQGNTCVCIISGKNLDQTLFDLGISSTINQFCGPNSTCSVVDNNKVVSTGPCKPISDISLNKILNKNKKSFPLFIFLFIVLLIILLIIIKAFYLYFM